MSAARRVRHATVTVLALWLVLLAALGTGDARVRGASGTVTLLASWTGGEEAAFRTVLRRFTEETGIRVEYQGTTALREVIDSGCVRARRPTSRCCRRRATWPSTRRAAN
ncbi:hypothetical protein NKH77_31605 [Streptomyces sp. M19]